MGTVKKVYLVEGNRVFSTGVFLVYQDNKFVVDSFEEDTFFNGETVEDIENIPYIETERV